MQEELTAGAAVPRILRPLLSNGLLAGILLSLLLENIKLTWLTAKKEQKIRTNLFKLEK
ncbi:MAG TPA: hypothetical protein VNM45_09585 [Bacillus sp. (in: firmicutes)]|nr:hypothetical protein [Bacillus sp. (in: firmicutes)]